MSVRSNRGSAWLRLGTAYMRHLVRRRVRPLPPISADRVRVTYEPDRLTPLQPEERELLSELSRCINCGLCALAVDRVGGVKIAELPLYLRDISILPQASGDVAGLSEEGYSTLQRAEAACPTRVPLAKLIPLLRRLARLS
jgi:hypothetical protein